jgi:hypothetical protein
MKRRRRTAPRAVRGPQVRGKKRPGGHEEEITIEELRKINEEAYQEARRQAEQELGIPLPATPAWTLEQILDPEFRPWESRWKK